ncbi:LysR substrate-binding domain-containing protein [Sorangium sp. So ce321]|uniref:LysR substrate-binding domain-containing protein n=1 Tax=Sorangium sp. So ce321 TaxID=3133300 RepID=UPI003F612FC8
MNRATDRFEGLTVFLTVARRRSFRAAAAELGVTAGAVSQSIQALERRVGLPLFARTTRRVGLTEAGEKLLERLAPAASEIGAALEALGELRERPAGLLRLTVPRMAVPFVIEPVLPRFRRAHPGVEVEISVDNTFVDLAETGFDAGVRIGEALAKDMIAVRLTGDLRWIVVGAPAYFAAHGRPEVPEDLLAHACIRYRFQSAALYRWEFARDGREIAVDVPGAITVNDGELALSLAREGLGLAYTADTVVAEDLARGTLATALDAYAPAGPGLFLYFPARAQTQAKLRAFIDTALAVLAPDARPAGPRR